MRKAKEKKSLMQQPEQMEYIALSLLEGSAEIHERKVLKGSYIKSTLYNEFKKQHIYIWKGDGIII